MVHLRSSPAQGSTLAGGELEHWVSAGTSASAGILNLQELACGCPCPHDIRSVRSCHGSFLKVMAASLRHCSCSIELASLARHPVPNCMIADCSLSHTSFSQTCRKELLSLKIYQLVGCMNPHLRSRARGYSPHGVPVAKSICECKSSTCCIANDVADEVVQQVAPA